jgi:hypothetical protein
LEKIEISCDLPAGFLTMFPFKQKDPAVTHAGFWSALKSRVGRIF